MKILVDVDDKTYNFIENNGAKTALKMLPDVDVENILKAIAEGEVLTRPFIVEDLERLNQEATVFNENDHIWDDEDEQIWNEER